MPDKQALLLLVLLFSHALAVTQQRLTVRCTTTKGDINLSVRPDLSPLGAEHFLRLVRSGFFAQQLSFFRVNSEIVQWGAYDLSDEAERERKRRGATWAGAHGLGRSSIRDEAGPPRCAALRRGQLAYAGGGPNTRGSQFIYVLHPHPMLGRELWEVPFAEVVGDQDLRVLDSLYKGYGDSPPWGKGPDQGQIMERGAAYLKAFPELDYNTNCMVMGDASIAKPNMDVFRMGLGASVGGAAGIGSGDSVSAMLLRDLQRESARPMAGWFKCDVTHGHRAGNGRESGSITVRLRPDWGSLNTAAASRLVDLIETAFFESGEIAIVKAVGNAVSFGADQATRAGPFGCLRGRVLDMSEREQAQASSARASTAVTSARRSARRGVMTVVVRAGAGTGGRGYTPVREGQAIEVRVALDDATRAVGDSGSDVAHADIRHIAVGEVIEGLHHLREAQHASPGAGGIDMSRLRKEGKGYLTRRFPQLSYITSCQTIDSKLHKERFLQSARGAVSAHERQAASQARSASDVAASTTDPYHVSLRR